MKRFDRETIIKLILVLVFLLLVFFILSLFIKNVTLEVVIFGLFFLFLAFNYQSDNKSKSSGSSVTIKSQDKTVSSSKAVNDIKDIKKEPKKEVYKDTKTKSIPAKEKSIVKSPEEKKKEEIKTPVSIKQEIPKKETKEIKEKEENKKVFIPAKVKDKEIVKEPVKLVLKDKPKEELKLQTKKTDDKINVKNLKVTNKKKLEDKVNIKKAKDSIKKSTVKVGTALKNIVTNKKEKLTNEENLMCAELSLFLFEKNCGLSRIPYRKTKDGYITVDSTSIKFKADKNERYMLVPKDKIKDRKLKETADKNNQVKISLDNGFDVLDEYLSSESKKIREKKTDKLTFLSFFPFTRKLSERILKKRQEKAKRTEYLRLYKLYSEIANIYHKSGDYDKEISFLTSAIEKFRSKGYSTFLLENKLNNAKRLAKEKEIYVKKKVKEKKD